MDDILRLPPQSISAEKSVLGSMLRDNDCIPEIILALRAEDFYLASHQTIFAAVVSLFDAGKPVDRVTLGERLIADGETDPAAIAYLAELWDAAPTAANAAYYAGIVRDRSLYRSLIHASTEILREAYDAAGPAETALEAAERRILDVSELGVIGHTVSIGSVLSDALRRIDARTVNSVDSGVPSGFEELDRLTTGFHDSELIIIGARPSVGKAQPLTASILTPTGFRIMGDLQVGDDIIGSDGKPKKIIGIYPQGVKQVYRVTTNDGAVTECCDDHLWFTQTRNERRRGALGSVKPLSEIRSSLYRENGETPNHHIPVVLPVDFARNQEPLPLDPWLIGFMLGDGSFGCSSQVRVHKPERDLLERVACRIPAADSVCSIEDGAGLGIRREKRNNKQSETKQSICLLGLENTDSYSKFIPEMYLFSSPQERLELLRGILDSDGHVWETGSGVEYATSSGRLSQDVSFLVRSLGGMVRVASRVPHYSYKGKRLEGALSYRLNIWFLDDTIPVSSEKHLAKWKKVYRRVDRTIASVEPIGAKICQCIRVDSTDGLYVTDDFIVTHNTAFSLAIARHVTVAAGLPVLFVSLEQSRVELGERLLCAQSNVDGQRIRRGMLSRDDIESIAHASEELQRGGLLHIDDTPTQGVTRISANARRLKRMHGIRLVIIDYLQLIEPEDRKPSRYEQMTDVSRRLKHMARELRVPVVALAQLNRESENRAGNRPRLADLRDTGAIEQDGDVIILLHRVTTPGGLDQLNLLLEKQRNGPTGEVPLMFRKNTGRFEAMAFGDDPFGGNGRYESAGTL